MDGSSSKRVPYLYRLLVASLIGLGFLWTSLAYIVQSYRMLDFLDAGTVDLLVGGVYYICQAIGIGFIALLFDIRPRTAGRRSVPMYVSITILICIAIAVLSSTIWVIVFVGLVMNLMIGALSGCYLSRLATDMPHHRRGIIFGGAYSFGSISTWLVSLFMGGKLLWDSAALIAILVPALISLILLIRLPQPPEQTRNHMLLQTKYNKRVILLIIVVLFLLSMENTLGFSFPLESASESIFIEFTRAFYATGLILAGYISDKSRRWGAICCMAALAFPFGALALGDSVSGETLMWILAYLFMGFFSMFRVLVFSDISEKTGMAAFAVLGLMAGRFGEAAGTLSGNLIGSDLIHVALAGVLFVLVIALFAFLYERLYAPVVSPEEMERRKFAEYVKYFGFSAREQEIFSMIVRGMSNSEIAAALCITESTVKFHVGNIFKKVGRGKRSDLVADFNVYGI